MLRAAPLLLPAIASITGIALSPYLGWQTTLCLIVIAIAWELIKKDPKPLALVAIILLSALYYTLRTNPGNGSLPTPNQNANWILKVQKIEPPHRKYQKVIATPLAAQDSNSVWIETPHTQLELYVDTALHLTPQKGNVVAARGKFRSVDGSYGAWLQAHGITGRIYTYRAAIVDSTTEPPSFADRAETYRQQLGDKIATASPDSAATALMAALAVSARSQMSPDQKNDYRRAGASHLLAISGLHVGIIVALLNLLLGALRLGLKGRIVYGVVVITLLWGYAWLTGMSPSVVRAVVMFSLLEIGLITLRSTSSVNLLAAAALIILLFDPRAVFDIGFQLSFVAMLGIVTLFRPLYNLWKPRFRWLEAVWGVTVVSVVAQLATAPLVAYTFGQLPLLGVAVNGVVWLTVPLVIVGTLLFLVGVPIGAPTAWVAMAQNEVITWVAGVEWGVLEQVQMPLWGVWVAYGVLVGAGAWFVVWKRKY